MPSGIIISPVNVVHNLGCYIDSKLTLEDHVNAVVKSCMYQLRQLHTVRRSLTKEAAAHLVRAFVSSKLDYCNAILFGISDRLIHKLQLVQNSAARLVTYTRRFEHITPVLRDQLHWLPIKQRVIYKLALYVRRALRSELPSYLAELLVLLTNTEHRAGLRSVTRGDLVQPERGLEIGQRSFRCSGPRIWNSLPTNVRDL